MLACRPFSFFYCVLLQSLCFSLVFRTLSLGFMGALYPSGVWLPWDGCGDSGVVAVLEPISQPRQLLRGLIRAFYSGGKHKRS